MVDLSPIEVGLVAYASKDLIEKLLGPTANYLGEGFKSIVQRRCDNINKILLKASRKLDSKIESPGVINPRIIKHILDEGSYCEDEVVLEYFAGVLASSRTEDISNDKMLPYLLLIEKMSSLELKLHYWLYTVFIQLLNGKPDINLRNESVLRRNCIFASYADLLELNSIDNSNYTIEELSNAMFSLINNGLIKSFRRGNKNMLDIHYLGIPSEGIVLATSTLGFLLYISGTASPINLEDCLYSDWILTSEKIIPLPKGTIVINKHNE